MPEGPVEATVSSTRERRRVRVVFYVDVGGIGGAEKNLASLVQQIDLDRFQPYVALTRRPGLELVLNEFSRRGLKYEVIDAASTTSLIRQFWNSFRFFRRVRPDVVHFNRIWNYGFVLPQIAARLSGARILILMENAPHALSKERRRHLGGLFPGLGLWRKKKALCYRLSFVLPNWVISPSRAGGEILLREYYCPCRKLVVIPYGVKTDLESEDSLRRSRRTELGFADEDLVIGSVGRFDELKGFQHLLPAFETVLGQCRSARLCLIGDGRLRQQLEDFVATRKLTARVSLPGWKSDGPSWLPCFDIFVFPSMSEGLPIALLEAAAARLPIVASRIPPVEEMITDGEQGVLVPPATPEALAAAIIRLARDPEERLRLANQARAAVIEKYTLEKMLARHMQLYALSGGGWERESWQKKRELNLKSF